METKLTGPGPRRPKLTSSPLGVRKALRLLRPRGRSPSKPAAEVGEDILSCFTKPPPSEGSSSTALPERPQAAIIGSVWFDLG